MSRFYLAATGCCYVPGVHQIPDGAIEINEAVYNTVIRDPEPGKVRAHDPNGLPLLVDPVVAEADLLVMERAWRDTQLARIVWLRDRHRDELDIGVDTTLSAEQFSELLVYIQSLREWPQSEAFPDSSARPEPPPFLDTVGGDQ